MMCTGSDIGNCLLFDGFWNDERLGVASSALQSTSTSSTEALIANRRRPSRSDARFHGASRLRHACLRSGVPGRRKMRQGEDSLFELVGQQRNVYCLAQPAPVIFSTAGATVRRIAAERAADLREIFLAEAGGEVENPVARLDDFRGSTWRPQFDKRRVEVFTDDVDDVPEATIAITRRLPRSCARSRAWPRGV